MLVSCLLQHRVLFINFKMARNGARYIKKINRTRERVSVVKMKCTNRAAAEMRATAVTV